MAVHRHQVEAFFGQQAVDGRNDRVFTSLQDGGAE